MTRTLYGLDFGTTNTVLTEWTWNQLEQRYVPQPKQLTPNTTLPSILRVRPDGTHVVGDLGSALGDFNSSFFSIKSLIRDGKGLDESTSTRVVHGKPYRLVDVVAAILRSVIDRGQINLDGDYGVCMSVPVHYGPNEREFMLQAAELAGLKRRSVCLTDEPLAGALSYGVSLTEPANVLIIDFGGGTLDLALVDMDQVRETVLTDRPNEVLAKDALDLGGDDIDHALMQWVIAQNRSNPMLRAVDLSIFNDRQALQRQKYDLGWYYELKRKCEQAKCMLSTATKAEIDVLSLGKGDLEGIQLTITREQLESLIEVYLEQLVARITALLERGGLRASDVNRVVLTGGSCLIPAVQRRVETLFPGRAKVFEPLTAIAQGDAIKASHMWSTDGSAIGEIEIIGQLVDITNFNYGIWDSYGGRGVKVIPHGSSIPLDRVYATKFRTTQPYQNTIRLVPVYSTREAPSKWHKFKRGGRDLEFRFPVDPRPGKTMFKLQYEIDPSSGDLIGKAFDLEKDPHERRPISGFKVEISDQ